MKNRVIIKTRVKAPDIDEKDVFENVVNLTAYKGKKILLGFYRHAGCPFCNVRVHALLKRSEYYKSKGLEMIFFFESTKETLLKSKFHKRINDTSVISDPERKVYSTYGVEQSSLKSRISHFSSFFQTVVKAKLKKLPVHWMKEGESFNTIPAEFLIDESGFVNKIHYFKGLTDQLSDELIDQFLNE